MTLRWRVAAESLPILRDLELGVLRQLRWETSQPRWSSVSDDNGIYIGRAVNPLPDSLQAAIASFDAKAELPVTADSLGVWRKINA